MELFFFFLSFFSLSLSLVLFSAQLLPVAILFLLRVQRKTICPQSAAHEVQAPFDKVLLSRARASEWHEPAHAPITRGMRPSALAIESLTPNCDLLYFRVSATPRKSSKVRQCLPNRISNCNRCLLLLSFQIDLNLITNEERERERKKVFVTYSSCPMVSRWRCNFV